MIISTALARPIIRGTRAVPPQPGNRPSFTSGNPNSVRPAVAHDAAVAPTRQLRPAAHADAIDGGHGDKRQSCSAAGKVAAPCGISRPSPPASMSSDAANSRKSAPAMKMPGLPEMITSPAKSWRPIQLVEVRRQLVQDRLRKDIRTLAGHVQGQQRNIRFRKRERHRGFFCHSLPVESRVSHDAAQTASKVHPHQRSDRCRPPSAPNRRASGQMILPFPSCHQIPSMVDIW